LPTGGWPSFDAATAAETALTAGLAAGLSATLSSSDVKKKLKSTRMLGDRSADRGHGGDGDGGDPGRGRCRGGAAAAINGADCAANVIGAGIDAYNGDDVGAAMDLAGAIPGLSETRLGERALEMGGELMGGELAKTGISKNQPETVADVDHDLYDLKVKTSPGVQVIRTTSNHPFWDVTLHKWVAAGQLRKGDKLRSANGATVSAMPEQQAAGCGTSPSPATTTTTST
jgi:hypothetical protein